MRLPTSACVSATIVFFLTKMTTQKQSLFSAYCTGRSCTKEQRSVKKEHIDFCESTCTLLVSCRPSSEVEHFHGKEGVTGSIPVGGSSLRFCAQKLRPAGPVILKYLRRRQPNEAPQRVVWHS